MRRFSVFLSKILSCRKVGETRHLLTLFFQTATETLRDVFRLHLALPNRNLGTIATIHTFGDYLIFHPHLHLLAADELFTSDGHFHYMPAEDLTPAIELIRPFSPPFGHHMSILTGHHLKSKFLAFQTLRLVGCLAPEFGTAVKTYNVRAVSRSQQNSSAPNFSTAGPSRGAKTPSLPRRLAR